MNKCSKCQTEYDGDVCPTCQKNEENKNENKTAEPRLKSNSFKNKICGFVDKYYAKLKLVPAITFLAYMVLSVLFMVVCPVAVVKVAGEKYGSVFNGKNFNEIPMLNNVAIVLRVVAIVSVIFTLIYVVYRFFTLRYAKVGKARVSFVLEIISAVLVFVLFVLACIIAGIINSADKGIDLVLVGSYSILSIILSILALLLIIATMVACFLYEKNHPELEVEFDKKRAEAKEKQKNRKHKKELSLRQKISTVIASIILVVLIFTFIGDSGYLKFDKSFEPKKLQSYVLKNNGEIDSISWSDISDAFGEGYVAIDEENNSSSSVATYYTSNFVKYKRKYERYSKYTEKAVEKGNVDNLMDWMNYELQLEMDKENMTYGEANIKFNKGYVESITYTVHSSKSSKKLINTKVMKCEELNKDEGKKGINYIVFMATYSDGSFVYVKVRDVNVELKDGTKVSEYEGSYKEYKLVWSYGSENFEYGITTRA